MKESSPTGSPSLKNWQLHRVNSNDRSLSLSTTINRSTYLSEAIRDCVMRADRSGVAAVTGADKSGVAAVTGEAVVDAGCDEGGIASVIATRPPMAAPIRGRIKSMCSLLVP